MVFKSLSKARDHPKNIKKEKTFFPLSEYPTV